ncbi:hypothetical protein SEA_ONEIAGILLIAN_26 [Microbacterium phage OneinaGillian]|uniref:Uncharacterized protein n=1 Tax=Microbacterium phage OneinaGillian TaxID=2301604 RepID=A0A385UG75_9CAUD|nr:hypothetical protein HOU23_gp026 [Microbacterium phage OneinaGillian]AYB70136.1 hypothetical protein SEA_ONEIAGILLIAN_26 [Microbacterium phage OneinaGillian]
MAPARIPEGFVFVRREAGRNVARELFEALDTVDGDRFGDILTVTGGYHVAEAVAEAWTEAQPEAEDDSTEDSTEDSTGDAGKTESTGDAGQTGDAGTGDAGTGDAGKTELEPLPVTAENTHDEIDKYAGELDPKVEFPANTNKADKIKLLEEARQPKSNPAE